MLMGTQKPTSGVISLGECRVIPNYFEQNQEALREYKGTVIAVSHDRYYLRQIVNGVVEVADHKLRDYNGDYNYYLEHNVEVFLKT